jgi:hypothetical protein
MANALLAAGAVPKGQTHWAPIFSNEFFSGLWTNRNPLRDPATPFIYGKFYSASRYEALWDGLNTEVSPRLTLIRAPGHSVFNANTFPFLNDFYSYQVDGVNRPNFVRLVADSADYVYDLYDATTETDSVAGTNTGQTILFTKSAGAGQTRFLSVGNTLYIGNGVDKYQYLTSGFKWKAGYAMPSGAFIVDGNGNIQLALGVTVPCTNIVINGGTLTATVNYLEDGLGNTLLQAGTQIVLENMNSAFLNGMSLVVTSVSATGPTITATIASSAIPSGENENPGADGVNTGFVVIQSLNGTLGSTAPTFNTNFNGLTLDNNGATPGTNLWQMKGPALRRWGIDAPTTIITPTNAINTSVASTWAANTYYMPSVLPQTGPMIVVGNYIWQLIAGGTTGGTPSFPGSPTVGSTTYTDGGATWKCVAAKTRLLSHAYALGALIAVTWTVTNLVTVQVPNPPSYGPYGPYGGSGTTTTYTYTYTYTAVFQCTTAGTTSNVADSGVTGNNPSPAWNSALKAYVSDGSVVWQNIGLGITRTDSATTGPVMTSSDDYTNVMTVGNIGNSIAVSLLGQVLDSNGAIEIVNIGGLSGPGPTAPSSGWSQIEGGSTTDNQITWINGGSSAAVGGIAAGTASWYYTYAYVDDITGSVGQAAPLSPAIVLAQNSYVQVQGAYYIPPSGPYNRIGTINIYRTPQGGPIAYLIAQIPNVPTAQGPWTYNDYSPDQGSPGSTMNNLLSADLIGYNSPPPDGFIPICLHLSSIWGFVDNVLYFSAGGDVTNMKGGWEAFPAGNNLSFQSTGHVGWGTNSGLYVILEDSIQLIAGTAPPFSPSRVVGIGIRSPNCFTLNGQSPFLFTSDRQVIGIDPSAGCTVDGFPIANLLAVAPFDPSTSYLTWHVDGTDQRLFIGDGAKAASGSQGYYNMINSITPEPPAAVWSPKRVIAAGCGCIKSVETYAGKYQMLVAPATSGPILYRDITKATDNGAKYAAWAIVGSNVLAHPGQIAEIGFIHLEAVRTGGVPKVAVLVGEVSGWPGCPPFDDLGKVVHDPPRLPESKSLHSNRYYMTQTGKPAWCRHLQIKIAFAIEDAMNEVLSFTAYGAIHLERSESGR